MTTSPTPEGAWLPILCRLGLHDYRWFSGAFGLSGYRACYRCGRNAPEADRKADR